MHEEEHVALPEAVELPNRALILVSSFVTIWKNCRRLHVPHGFKHAQVG